MYQSASRRLAFRVIMRGPSHIPRKMIVKAYSIEPLVPKAPMEAVKSEMTRGPQRSHFYFIFW